MKLQRISRLLCLALGLTVFAHSKNMAPAAETTNPVVKTFQIISTTGSVGTNGSDSMRYVGEGLVATNWTLGQASTATEWNTNNGSAWVSSAWMTNSTNWTLKATDWPTGSNGTVTTTTFTVNSNSYPQISSNSYSGPAAAYVPPTSDWHYATNVVQVTTDSSGGGITTNNAKAILHLETHGGTNYGASSLFKLTASASQIFVTLGTNAYYPYNVTSNTTTIGIPPGDIAISGLATNNLSCDTNGILFVGLNNNATYTIQPVLPAQYTNYIFNLSVERKILNLSPHFSGSLVARETVVNGVTNGYGAFQYDLESYIAGTTNLGSMLNVQQFSSVDTNGNPILIHCFANQQNTTATVFPEPVFAGGWQWQRDVIGRVYDRYPTDPANSINTLNFPGLTKNFTQGAPPLGGNDHGAPEDPTPDSSRLIVNADSPAIQLNITADNYPEGSIVFYRMYAHEWVTWSGKVVSNVIKWHSFTTIKKKSGVWVYVGRNEIGPTATTDPENPIISLQDLQDAINQ